MKCHQTPEQVNLALICEPRALSRGNAKCTIDEGTVSSCEQVGKPDGSRLVSRVVDARTEAQYGTRLLVGKPSEMSKTKSAILFHHGKRSDIGDCHTHFREEDPGNSA